MTDWAAPETVLAPQLLDDVIARWQRVCERWPFVRLLEAGPGVGLVPGEADAGVAPALAALVEALPGVRLGGWQVDWPRAESQRWAILPRPRAGYQPVWAAGREAVVVLVDPETGEAGEVVLVADEVERAVLPAAPDVVTWWERLAAWTETTLGDLEPLLRGDAVDEEDLHEQLVEALDLRFGDFLRSSWGATSG